MRVLFWIMLFVLGIWPSAITIKLYVDGYIIHPGQWRFMIFLMIVGFIGCAILIYGHVNKMFYWQEDDD